MQVIAGIIPLQENRGSRLCFTKSLSYLGHLNGIYEDLPIKYYLGKEGITILCNEFKFKDDIFRPIYTLSSGQKRIISMISIIEKRERLWLLDEPFCGLDNNAKENIIRFMVKHISINNGSIIMTNHEKIKNIMNIFALNINI